MIVFEKKEVHKPIDLFSVALYHHSKYSFSLVVLIIPLMKSFSKSLLYSFVHQQNASFFFFCLFPLVKE